jgi:hypothetical protein
MGCLMSPETVAFSHTPLPKHCQGAERAIGQTQHAGGSSAAFPEKNARSRKPAATAEGWGRRSRQRARRSPARQATAAAALLEAAAALLSEKQQDVQKGAVFQGRSDGSLATLAATESAYTTAAVCAFAWSPTGKEILTGAQQDGSACARDLCRCSLHSFT